MQRCESNNYFHIWKSFSIHKRIEGGATCPQGFTLHRIGRLSVSTSGSKGVQHSIHQASIFELCTFQYPQADRRGCNLSSRPVSTTARSSFSIHKRIEGGATRFQVAQPVQQCALSVSTSGSKGVQLGSSFLNAPVSETFSIHKRIEGGATEQMSNNEQAFIIFQYPQADRRGCNDPNHKIVVEVTKAFSIHKRIEGGATHLTPF